MRVTICTARNPASMKREPLEQRRRYAEPDVPCFIACAQRWRIFIDNIPPETNTLV